MIRELSLAPHDLIHPQAMPNGAVTWAPGAGLDDLQDRLRAGDPSKGWEGDPRLTLAHFRHPISGDTYWELWRLEHDNAHRMVCRSRANMPFPHGLIERLVEHDRNRGFNLHETVMQHNRKVNAERDVPSERLQAAHERLAWAIRKDLG